MSNASLTTVEQPANWVELLQYQARCHGERTCFSLLGNGSDVSASISYAELDQRARALAVELLEHARAGDRAMLLMPNGIDYVVGFFGCIYAGLIAVTAYPPQHKRRDWGRISGMLTDCEAAVVLCAAEHSAKVNAWLQAEAHGCRLLQVGSESLVQAAQWQMPQIDKQTVAYLQYSSGSTGSPKGVMLGHGNLLHNTALIAREFGMGGEDRFVSWLPMYHDMGFIGGVLTPLALGAATWLIPPPVALQNPYLWLKAISDFKATTSGGPNFIFEHCVARISEVQKAGLDLSHWRCSVNGAEPIQARTLADFNCAFASSGLAQTTLKPSYGMAETCLFVTATPEDERYRAVQLDKTLLQQGRVSLSDQNSLEQAGSGRINDQMDVRIVDPQSGQSLPADQVGEIWIRGASVAQGYWNKPELSAATFGNQIDGVTGYLRTGDLGFILDGHLYVCGRRKEMLIVNGRNHYPQDIEATIQTVDSDLAAHGGAVFELGDGSGQVIAVQELSRQGCRREGLDQLITRIRQAVAEVHEITLAAVVLIAPVSLPKTTSGKIQRLQCRDQYQQQSLRIQAQWQQSGPGNADQAEVLPPLVAGDSGQISAWICGWIAHRLGIAADTVDASQELVATGLDSVDAMTLTHELAEGLGRELSPDLVWHYPTIDALAQYLEESLAVAPQSEPEQELLLEGEI
ncbi:AMP-binding protein, partial [Marinobacterium jannaschii]|uniref:AMP-binding protein n=1 Tax=Marinobacterium jannaschii TaxID=64970 RepID=UPI000565F08F